MGGRKKPLKSPKSPQPITGFSILPPLRMISLGETEGLSIGTPGMRWAVGKDFGGCTGQTVILFNPLFLFVNPVPALETAMGLSYLTPLDSVGSPLSRPF